MEKKYFKAISFCVIIQVLFILTGGTGIAQRMRMSVDERVKSLTEQLSLTKTQADSIRKIYLESDSIRVRLLGAQQGESMGMRDFMRKIQDSTDAKIDSLLTKDQREKFVEIKKQRPRRAVPPPARRPDMD